MSRWGSVQAGYADDLTHLLGFSAWRHPFGSFNLDTGTLIVTAGDDQDARHLADLSGDRVFCYSSWRALIEHSLMTEMIEDGCGVTNVVLAVCGRIPVDIDLLSMRERLPDEVKMRVSGPPEGFERWRECSDAKTLMLALFGSPVILPVERRVIPDRRMDRAKSMLIERFGENVCPGDAWPIRFHAGRWWMWDRDRNIYRHVEEKSLVADLTETLDRFDIFRKYKGEVGARIPFAPTARTVRDVLEAVIGYVSVPGSEDETSAPMPCWLPEQIDANGSPIWDVVSRSSRPPGPIPSRSVVAFSDGLLDADTFGDSGEVVVFPKTPRWFSASACPFPCPVDVLRKATSPEDLDAECFDLCPRWLDFMTHISDGCLVWQEVAQRWFGYMLTPDTSLEKALWLQGLPGSGKGTFVEMMIAVLGPSNVASTYFDAFGSETGMGDLVGKLGILLSELHVGRHTNVAACLETLKRVTSADPVRVRDLYQQAATMRLCGRVVITPNTSPKLPDESAALVRRLVPLVTNDPPKKPDPTLKKMLRDEAAGVMVWSLSGLWKMRRALASGEPPFPETAAGTELVESMARGWAPVRAFVDDCCIAQAGSAVKCSLLREVFEKWQEENGYVYSLTAEQFGHALRACVGKIRRASRSVKGERWWQYEGIRPRDAGEDAAQPGPPKEVDRESPTDPGRFIGRSQIERDESEGDDGGEG